MTLLNDIYCRVDRKIVEQGFWKVSIDEKKQLIDEELKKYIMSKINEIGGNTSILSNEKMSVNDLLRMLARIIPQEQHFDTLRHFTHYVLNIMSSLQNYSICWWVEEDEKLINLPLIEFEKNGLLTNLKTHKETDYVKTFDFVYNAFTNNFMTKSNSKTKILHKLES